jgi:hypothetical protein
MAVASGEGSDWCRYSFADRPFLEAVAAVIVEAWVHATARLQRLETVHAHEGIGASHVLSAVVLWIDRVLPTKGPQTAAPGYRLGGRKWAVLVVALTVWPV